MPTMTSLTARIVTSNGRQWWRCQCGRTLGELVGATVVIKSGNRWLVIERNGDQAQRCPDPRCGRWSVLREDEAA